MMNNTEFKLMSNGMIVTDEEFKKVLAAAVDDGTLEEFQSLTVKRIVPEKEITGLVMNKIDNIEDDNIRDTIKKTVLYALDCKDDFYLNAFMNGMRTSPAEDLVMFNVAKQIVHTFAGMEMVKQGKTPLH